MVNSKLIRTILITSLIATMWMIFLLLSSSTWNLFWLVILLWTIAVIFPLILKGRDPFEFWIPFVAYFVVLFPIRAIYDVFRGEAKFFDLSSNAWIFTIALIYGLLSLLAFYLGYFHPWGRRLAKRLPALTAKFSTPRLYIIGSAFLLVGFVSLLLLLRTVPLFAIWSPQGDVLSKSAFKGKYYLLWGIDFFILLFIFLYASKDRRIPKPFVFASFLLATVVGILLGAKETILQPFFYWLVIRHYTRKPIGKRGIAFFSLALVLVLFTFPFFRHFGPKGLEKIEAVVKTENFWKTWPDYIISRFYGVESLTLILKNVPEAFPYKYGETFFELFIQPIPRVLWPTKPISVGFQFTQAFTSGYYGSSTSSALSLPGELYLNFGLPGILFGFMLLGLIGRIIYEYLGKRSGASYVILYALTLYALVMLNEGNVSGRLPFYLTKLIPSIFAIFYLSPKGDI